MEKFIYKVSDENGIHARPAGIIVKCAKKFESELFMTYNGKQADMRKLFALMQLGVTAGAEIVIEATGDDEKEAVTELEKVMIEAGL